MMREIDGTVTISLKDFEWLKGKWEERYEEFLDIPQRVDTNRFYGGKHEYLVNINELISAVIDGRGKEVKILSIEPLSDTEYQVKAEIEYYKL